MNLDLEALNNVSDTMLIPLYARAWESTSSKPLIIDQKALEIIEVLNPLLSKSKKSMHRKLFKKRLPVKLIVTLSLRSRKFDHYVRNYLNQNSPAVIVNFGCGLDTRFSRLDNGNLHWYDLDFPEVIELKKNFFQETENYHFLPYSLLDSKWLEIIQEKYAPTPILFLAEGVFMYLYEKEVRKLVLGLTDMFPGSELVFEITNSYWVNKMQKGFMKRKFQRKFNLEKDVTFHFGISQSEELESWDQRLQFLDDWTYFDEDEPKLGWFNWFKNIELIRKTQWIVHYKLG